MNKLIYILRIVKNRWFSPSDKILIRFNTKAAESNPLKWRVFVNGRENLASGFQIHGFVNDEISHEGSQIKYNLSCQGRIRWEGDVAVIFAAKKGTDDPIS